MMSDTDKGTIEILAGSWAPEASKTIDLVFRTVGERTSDLALQLALTHVKPNRAYIVRNVRPSTLAVERMLAIDHQSSHVVYVDADCLIFEDMRPFLNANDLPFVGCFVYDRFRGRVNCGVHIIRTDVIQKMSTLKVPDTHFRYVLQPESYLHTRVLKQMGVNKQYVQFEILHDYLQWNTDIFSKYAFRELRSQLDRQRDNFHLLQKAWGEGSDFLVAKHAVVHVGAAVSQLTNVREINSYIDALPHIAEVEILKLGLKRQEQISERDVENAIEISGLRQNTNPRKHRGKVFGIGLARTGTLSLTNALNALGFNILHYPLSPSVLRALEHTEDGLPLLEFYDGMTDITTLPILRALDEHYPGSKFILTVRDVNSWLESCRRHWNKPQPVTGNEDSVRVKIRIFLRNAIYGSMQMSDENFLHVYQSHLENIKEYFKGRESSLLILDIAKGEGYERLAPFLGVAAPDQQFPHENRTRKHTQPESEDKVQS